MIFFFLFGRSGFQALWQPTAPLIRRRLHKLQTTRVRVIMLNGLCHLVVHSLHEKGHNLCSVAWLLQGALSHSERKEMYFHSTLTWPSNPGKSRHLERLWFPLNRWENWEKWGQCFICKQPLQIKSKEKESRTCSLFQQEESKFSLFFFLLSLHIRNFTSISFPFSERFYQCKLQVHVTGENRFLIKQVDTLQQFIPVASRGKK